MSHLSLANLKKSYGSTAVVHGIDLAIESGEFIVLVGPSGCGKSTVLRMIAGLEEVTDGEISIDDVVVNCLPPKDRHISMVFQNYALYPHMTVYENMAFGLRVRKLDRKIIDERVNDAAKTLAIQDYLDRKPQHLSGGQRQRVAIGRAIVRKPQIFLFDEPLSNLDAKLRAQMRYEIQRLHARLDATIVYVTHDQTEAMTMADRIVVLQSGKIEQVGSPKELYEKPRNQFVAAFIGSPQMNFIRGEVVVEYRSCAVQNSDITLRLPDKIVESEYLAQGRCVTVGVRPEHISVKPLAHGDSAGANEIVAKLDVVEPLGHETHLLCRVGSLELQVKTTSKAEFKRGDLLTIRFDVDALHFFDPETEERLPL